MAAEGDEVGASQGGGVAGGEEFGCFLGHWGWGCEGWGRRLRMGSGSGEEGGRWGGFWGSERWGTRDFGDFFGKLVKE